MTTGTIGVKPGNVIVPVTNLMKQTKWIPLVLTTDITCPQAGFAVTKCLAQFSADSAGQWTADIDANFTINSATITSVVTTFVNMTFYNGLTTSMSGSLVGADLAAEAYADSNASTITITCASTGSVTGINIRGKALLKSEPTTYTIAANMENIAGVDVYISPCAAGTEGIINNLTANTLGNPIKGKTDGVAVAAGYVGECISDFAAGVAINTSTFTTIASLSGAKTLTAGIWDISAVLNGVAAASLTAIQFGIATATNSQTGLVTGDNRIVIIANATIDAGGSIPCWRVNLSASKDYFLTAASGGANTTASGRITAVRAS